MRHNKKRYLLSITLCISSIIAYSVDAQDRVYSFKKNTPPHTQLNQHIQYYRDLYPDISFLLLKGGNELRDDMMTLDLVLGYKPSSLDYEHPPDSREDLMFVSAWRIKKMLEANEPSASTFKADKPLGWPESVCVITINPNELALNSIQSTQHLLSMSVEEIKKIPQHMRLPPADYLSFVIDHEIYHCLQSIYAGPQLMSDKPLWAEYNQFLDEQAADAYALGMHIRMFNKESIFIKNIQRIRGMSLYNADPNHLTNDALKRMALIPDEKLYNMTPHEIYSLANEVKDFFSISYDKYTEYLSSSIQAMLELGVEESVLEEIRNSTKHIPAKPNQVKVLTFNARQCFSELRNKENDFK